MNFFHMLKQRIFLFLFLIIFLSLIPFSISYIINQNTCDYKLEFTYDSYVDVSKLISKSNLDLTKDSLSDTYIYNTDKIEKDIKIYEEDNYILLVHKIDFNSKKEAKAFLTTLLENESVIGQSKITYINSLDSVSYVNPIKVLLISLPISIILVFNLFILLYKFKPSFYNLNIEYDNVNLYKFVFHKSYWKNQISYFKYIRSVVTLAILFALMKVLGFITLPSGFSNLGIGLSYLVFSVIGLIYGPITGFIVGVLSDILGFFMGQSGNVFHIGYTLNAALAGFIYGICLYKTNITFTKCLFSRILVNLFVNVFLGSLWWGDVSSFNLSQTLNYMLVISLPKNLFYLIPQSIIMYLLIKALVKPLCITQLISEAQANQISLI